MIRLVGIRPLVPNNWHKFFTFGRIQQLYNLLRSSITNLHTKGKYTMTAHIVPGPKGNFLLGSMRDLQHDPLAFLQSIQRDYGGIATFRLGPRRVYLVSDPDYVREVLVAQAKIVSKASFNKNLLGRFLGNGILTNDGESHRQQRKLVQPAFHHQKIARYADTMVTLTANMLDGWEVDHSYDIDGEMMRLTMAIIAQTAFGTEVDEVFQRVGDAIAVLQAITIREFKAGYMLPEWIPTANNRQRQQASKVMSDTVLGFIRERRASGEERDDLLSMLLHAQDEDNGRVMTDEQVRDEAVTLFAAGHETTSNALTWTWYLLSQHPQVETTLHEELDRVLGDRLPTLADLDNLPYTEMIIKESMRLYPPAWNLMTRVSEEPLALGEYRSRRVIGFLSRPTSCIATRISSPTWNVSIPRVLRRAKKNSVRAMD